MLGIGFFEIVIIALVCFIAIGPKQLPTVMRRLAQFYRQFNVLRDELRFQIMSADDILDPKEPVKKPVPDKLVENTNVVPRKQEQNHG